MAILSTYTDDTTTTASDKFLTVDTSGSTKLTAASTLGSYVLSTGNVPAAALSTSAITLGYAQTTSAFSTSSTSPAVQVTGLSVTVTIPTGGRKIRITAYATSMYNATADRSTELTLWDGTVGTGTQLASSVGTSATSNAQAQALCVAVVTPSAGSKTYNVGLRNAGGTLSNLSAGAGQPAFILVEAI